MLVGRVGRTCMTRIFIFHKLMAITINTCVPLEGGRAFSVNFAKRKTALGDKRAFFTGDGMTTVSVSFRSLGVSV